MANIKMSNSEIAKRIGEMCYQPNENKDAQAIQLFFEKMCLPKYEDWYTPEIMTKYIKYFMKNKKIFEPTPSQTKL